MASLRSAREAPKTASTITAMITNHQCWISPENAIRARVRNGSCWPVVSNTPTTFGTTYTSIRVTMKKAIQVKTIG